MLAAAHPLGVVDTGMAGEQIADHAGDAGIRSSLCAKQLHGHQRGRNWRVGCTGKHRGKSHSRKQRRRAAAGFATAHSQGRANVEKRSHLAALEAGSERNRGEHKLGREVIRRQLAY